MTLQELFKSINEDEFIDVYLRNDTQTLDLIFDNSISLKEKVKKIEDFKEIILNTLHLFQTMQTEKNDEYIVFAIPSCEDDALADSFLVERDKLLQMQDSDNIEHYSYMMSPHEEVLSYDISKASRLKIDDDVCLAVSIFNEMTFCGVTEESYSEQINDIKNRIDEVQKEHETNPENFKPIDDLFKELGWEDNRTEEEKEFCLTVDKIEGKAYAQICKKYYEMEKYYLSNT
jgi:hypothetical protein